MWYVNLSVASWVIVCLEPCMGPLLSVPLFSEFKGL